MKVATILEVHEAKALVNELESTGNALIADVCRVMAVALLRVGDAIALRYSDIQRGTLSIKEQKTGKEKSIQLPPNILEIIATRRKAYPKDTYLFCSKSNRASGDKPVSREYVSRIISRTAKAIGIEGTISAHSFRKYGASSVYENSGGDIALARKLLNHSSFDVTCRYLRLDEKTAGKAVSTIEI